MNRFDSFARSLGIAFVPVSADTKQPYHANWTQREFESTDFASNDSVGAKWGAPSNDLVDIDADSVEAGRLAKTKLLKGPQYGSPKNPHGHTLVISPGARTKPFVSPLGDKPMLFEIRSTGAQSVLPPSSYKGGGYYEWRRQDDPLTIDPIELVRDVGELAAAALIATVWSGARHKLAVALSGFLAKNGVNEERAHKLMTLVTIAARDDEPKDRLRAVEDTYRKYANGEDVRANFIEELGEADSQLLIKTLVDWLQLARVQFRILSEHEFLNRPPAKFVVDDFLVEGSLAAVVSPPDIGKTFLALDLSYSIAAGCETFLGKKLFTYGPIVYVIGEGLGRFPYRVKAWRERRNESDPLPTYWVTQPVDLVDEKAGLAFMRQVAPIKPKLIVFDTLSRCIAGADENNQKDMSAAIHMCDELRQRTGAIVLLLHHTRKDGQVERGSTVIRGAVDTMVFLEEKTRGVIKLNVDRQKDGDQLTLELVRRVVALKYDAEPSGRPVTSCVIELATADAVHKAQKPDFDRAVAILMKHPDGLKKTKLAEFFGGRRQRVLQLLDAMIEKNLIFEDDGRLYVAGVGYQRAM